MAEMKDEQIKPKQIWEYKDHRCHLKWARLVSSKTNAHYQACGISDRSNLITYQNPCSRLTTIQGSQVCCNKQLFTRSSQPYDLTWAARRVLTRSSGYVVDAAVIPAKPPPRKWTKRSALMWSLWRSRPGTMCSIYITYKQSIKIKATGKKNSNRKYLQI